jgi:hypothetical protein
VVLGVPVDRQNLEDREVLVALNYPMNLKFLKC